MAKEMTEYKEKADKRWWHSKEYPTERNSLVIGRNIKFLWYSIEHKRFSLKYFKSIDMYYAHIALLGKVLEFHYYRR